MTRRTKAELATVYDVRRMDTSEDAAERAALARAARVLADPVITRIVSAGVATDGIPLVQYEMQGESL